MAELVDAHDSKSCVLVTCGFDSHSRYREKRREFHAFFISMASDSMVVKCGYLGVTSARTSVMAVHGAHGLLLNFTNSHSWFCLSV